MEKEKNTHLKYFGIGKILPYLRKVKKLIFIMMFFGLVGSLTDIILPLFQRYALDHFIGLGVFDTIVVLPFCWQQAPITFPAPLPPSWKCVSTANCGRPVLSICRRCHSPTSTRTASAISMRG